MVFTKQLIEKAKGKKCDICYESITDEEADNKDFEYSKTKRKNEVFVHSRCWEKENCK